jgi:H+/gluconate symporter-like permease
MEPILCLILLTFVISLPLCQGVVFAELTKEDVRQIVREEIEPLKIEIATIKGDIKALEGRMAGLEGKMATKDDLLSMWKDITGKMETLYGLLIGVLLAIIVSVILPPIFQKWFERRKEHQYSKEIEELKQEIAALKGKVF